MNKTLLIAAVTLLAQTAQASIEQIDVIYGKDNRQDVYQSTDSLHKKLAQSTAAMINIGRFEKASSTVFNLQANTLERAVNLCTSEAFAQQPAAASCSGFLVSPDTIITAGHCYKGQQTPEEACKSNAWVFGFEMTSAKSEPLKDVSISNIYRCKSVVAAELTSNLDYAIIKLDRKVVGRTPLKFRTSGKIENSASLVVIGHPTGIPTKISAGGKVNRNVQPTTFSTNLDTFHGNSGSAVFDAKTGVIEGILIQGKTDYIPSKKGDSSSCMVVNKCDDDAKNCTAGTETGTIQWGEVVLRITAVSEKITNAIAETKK